MNACDNPNLDPADRAEFFPPRSDGAVASLLAEVEQIDPGLRAAEIAPFGSRERNRHERIRDHYIAYGIRHALLTLGLMPNE